MNGLTMRSKKKLKDILKQMKMGTQQPKMYGETTTVKVVLRETFVALQAYLKKKTRKSSNKQSNFTLKRT